MRSARATSRATSRLRRCAAAVFVGFVVLVVGCGGGPAPTEPVVEEVCGPFEEWSTSEFVLPYPVGASHVVLQANCSGFGHSRFWKHGYDFDMPIGTAITAARDGTVVHAIDGVPDGDRLRTNLLTLRHSDGTVTLYSHLTRGGALVEVGDFVRAGELIALSGDTGNTGGVPHLHFSLHPCAELPGLPNETNCPSLPLNFSNAGPNPNGLVAGTAYAAGPH